LITALDFSRLQTPPHHGDVLVEPAAAQLAEMLETNRRALAALDVRLGGEPLSEIRRRLRAALGFGEGPLVVTGHQPEFIHAGVWAKHVVAVRLAEAVGGSAVNLVVDHDAPRVFAFTVPRVEGSRVRGVALRYADWPAGAALEGLPATTPAAADGLRDAVAEALGALYPPSQFPAFWKAYRETPNPVDWVDQAVSGRRAVEQQLGVVIADRRVSTSWSGPLLCTLLGDACRFAAAYNAALSDYRVAQGIAGTQRPMPDLDSAGPRCETALWIYRLGAPRRRLFVENSQGRIRLYAGAERVAEWPERDTATWAALAPRLAELAGWVVRPRALVLTLWARLALGDLFIHGIGGAKYDRITDELIRRYFGVEPPHMACVSATLRLPLPGARRRADELKRAYRAAQHAARDMRFNPERHLPAEVVEADVQRKRAAVAEAQRLRRDEPANHLRRREVFREIRALNAALTARFPEAVTAADDALREQQRTLQAHAVASSREYFFAMHRRADLALLLENLPQVTQLRSATIV